MQMLSQSQKIGFTAGVVVLFAMFMWAMAIENRWTAACLDRAPVAVAATIADKQTKLSKNNRSYTVHYRFAVGDGEVDGWQRVSRDYYEAAYIGQPVTAIHCAGNAARHTLHLPTLQAEVAHSTRVATFVSLAMLAVLLITWAQEGYPLPGPHRRSRADDNDIVWTEPRRGLFRRLFR